MAKKQIKIVILGGGFAGIKCTKILEKHFKNQPEIDLVLVNEDNFLLFTPMLPQVASGMIETRHITMPIRKICENTTFYEGRIKEIDPHGKLVTLWGTVEKRGIAIHYDFLIVALGSQTNFFGLSDVEKNAYTMKTLNDAVAYRNRIIDMLEQAENETNPILRKSLLTFVIVGAGFAGVETSGEIMDLLRDARRYYPNIRQEDIRVIILEALSGILPGFNEKLAKFAYNKMVERGIEIQLRTAVTSFDGTEVKVKKLNNDKNNSNEIVESIITKTLMWTAGVAPVNAINRALFKKERGKILVNEFLEVKDFPGVFALGDCAFIIDPDSKKPLSPTAQLAEAEAEVAAFNLHALMKNKEMKKFIYKSKGQMAIIGKRTGIASIFGVNIAGFWAWILWRNVYLTQMPRFDKRFRVLLDWTIDLFFDRDISRMKFVTRPTEKEYKNLDEVDDFW